MINDYIKKAFDLKGIPEPLEGGQGTSIKFNNKVIKPIDDPDYYNWCMAIWNQLEPKSYRINKPVMTSNQFAFKGYGVTYYEEGYEDDCNLIDKLKVAKALHRDLRNVTYTLRFADDPWTKAHQVLWHDGTIEKILDKDKKTYCKNILNKLPKIDCDYQLIHSDLGGNILFHKDLNPLVIDFSPAYAPEEYAEAIIICDSIAWAGCKLESINLLSPIENFKPYILYAIAFRVLTIGFNDKYNMNRMISEWNAYQPIWQYITQMEV